MRALIFAVLAAGCASVQTATHEVTPAPVIAAERAFAARAGEIGWIPAFREYTAPDGQIIGQAGIVSAPERMAQLEDDGERGLYWAPVFAGIARSGDFGFTTGPVSFDAERTPRMQYFTVWRKQADGSWKWIFDGGPGAVEAPGPFPAAGQEPETLPVSEHGAGSATAAVAQVNAIEGEAGSAAGLARFLATEAHVYRSARARALAEAAAASAYPSGDVRYELVRTEASAAGDMVFTLGHARWSDGGAERQGHFARVWQAGPEGWRIVYDQLVIPRAPG